MGAADLTAFRLSWLFPDPMSSCCALSCCCCCCCWWAMLALSLGASVRCYTIDIDRTWLSILVYWKQKLPGEGVLLSKFALVAGTVGIKASICLTES